MFLKHPCRRGKSLPTPARAAPSVLARITKCVRKRNGTGTGLLTGVRWDFDLKAVAAAAEHAILVFAYLHHGVGEPQPASDQYEHDRRRDHIHHHPMTEIVITGGFILA